MNISTHFSQKNLLQILQLRSTLGGVSRSGHLKHSHFQGSPDFSNSSFSIPSFHSWCSHPTMVPTTRRALEVRSVLCQLTARVSR